MTISYRDASQARETALHCYHETFTPRAPYSFAQTLRFMRRFTPMDGEQTIMGGTLTKAVALGGRAVVGALRDAGAVDAPRLSCEVSLQAPPSAGERVALRNRIQFFLSLDDDLAPFYAIARDAERHAVTCCDAILDPPRQR